MKNFNKPAVLFTLMSIVLSVSAPVQAQELQGTQNPLAQEMMKVAQGQERAKAFEMAMRDVSVPEQQAFWEVYKGYAIEKSKYDERRLRLMDKYMSKLFEPHRLPSRPAHGGVDSLQKEELSYRVKTYKKLSHAVSPLVATRFYQVDDYVSASTKVDAMSRYPIFGERPTQ